MLNKFIRLVGILLLLVLSNNLFSNPKNKSLEVYYSRQITYNLNHIINTAKNLYQLTNKKNFGKIELETELTRLENEIKLTNKSISEMIKHIPAEKLKEINKHLKKMDEHLAGAYVDALSLKKLLGKNIPVDISGIISDIYSQIKKAETEDHREIKKLQNHLDYKMKEIEEIQR
ncbi:MAG: hypothetical protein HND52_14695 [Ignavibacteriae bacterium]|nr:hypothetical protein [Ignavibacteriota bacterium]NOG99203.1 hypothetical protein [Ignavibacteriota bacterium]